MGVLPFCADLFCYTILLWPQKVVELVHLLTLINWGYRGQLLVPSGMVCLLRTTAQGPSFFSGVFMSMGNVGGNKLCDPAPPEYMGEWVGGSEAGWVGEPRSQGGQFNPQPGVTMQCPPL